MARLKTRFFGTDRYGAAEEMRRLKLLMLKGETDTALARIFNKDRTTISHWRKKLFHKSSLQMRKIRPYRVLEKPPVNKPKQYKDYLAEVRAKAPERFKKLYEYRQIRMTELVIPL